MLDIGAEPAGFQMYFAAGRMLAEKAAPLLGGFGKKIDGPVQADLEKIVTVLQAGETSLIFQIGPVAAEACLDHVARFRVRADIARQRQQLQCRFQIDPAGRGAFWKRRPFRFFRFRIAELNIGAIGTVADIDGNAAGLIVTKMAVADNALF